MAHLARAATASSIRLRIGRIPRPLQPTAIERSYHAAIIARVNTLARRHFEDVRGEVLQELVRLRQRQGQAAGERQDADPDAREDGRRARALIDGAARRFAEEFRPRDLHAVAEQFGRRLDEHARAQLDAQLRAAIGVPLSALSKPLRDQVEGWAATNVDLISTVPERYFDRLRAHVEDAFEAGTHPATLAEEMSDAYEVSVNDARRIARDQLGKLNADVTQARHEEIGVTRYTWRTSRDGRVRDNHVDLEGVVCSYDDPPMGGGTTAREAGHPGSGIECRCYPEPYLQDIIDGTTGGAAAPPGPDESDGATFAPTDSDPVGAHPGIHAARQVATIGLRDEHLEYLREGMRDMTPFRDAYAAARSAGIDPTTVATTGEYPGGKFPPIRLEIQPTGEVHLHDGRHRYTAAREQGARAILARIVVRGPRGGRLRDVRQVVPLL